MTLPTQVSSAPVAVLLCKDLGKRARTLDLKALCASLEANLPDAAIEILPDLCDDLGQIVPAIRRHDADGVVLGLCSGDYSHTEVQSRIKKGGLDPFAVEVVPLGTWCGPTASRPEAIDKARALLAGAVARVRALRPSGPENSRLQFVSKDQKLSRRALFTVRPVGYRPVPSVITDRCRAENGCRLCVEACPVRALEQASRCVSIDKAKCGSCGVCLSACPNDAMDFHGSSVSQITAQVCALLDSEQRGATPANILFACQMMAGRVEALAHSGEAHFDRWLPVVLPCAGMVTPGWVLQTLAHGAESVAVMSCDERCRCGQTQTIEGRVDFCRKLLALSGQAHRVIVWDGKSSDRMIIESEHSGDDRSGPCDAGLPLRLESAASTFHAIQRLNHTCGGAASGAIKHPHSPFGILEIDDSRCTGCLSCTATCPTGALIAEGPDSGGDLSYVPSACIGCRLCERTCDRVGAEALRVRNVTDLDALGQERIILRHGERATCIECGGAIASDALLRRIEDLLGKDDPSLKAWLSAYCPDCRMKLVCVGTTGSKEVPTLKKAVAGALVADKSP